MDKDSRCSGCGNPFAETVGEDNFDKWNARMVTCDACRATSRTAYIAAGREDLDQTAGARYITWKDPVATNGSSG